MSWLLSPKLPVCSGWLVCLPGYMKHLGMFGGVGSGFKNISSINYFFPGLNLSDSKFIQQLRMFDKSVVVQPLSRV